MTRVSQTQESLIIFQVFIHRLTRRLVFFQLLVIISVCLLDKFINGSLDNRIRDIWTIKKFTT